MKAFDDVVFDMVTYADKGADWMLHLLVRPVMVVGLVVMSPFSLLGWILTRMEKKNGSQDGTQQ